MRGDKELVEIHLLLSPSSRASESPSSEMQREARRTGHDCSLTRGWTNQILAQNLILLPHQ